MMKKMNKGKLKKRNRIIVLMCVTVILVFGGGYTFYLNELSAVNEKKENVIFVIEEGETMSSVLDRLQQQNLIKNSTIAGIHARLSNQTQNKAGSFILNDSMSVDEILHTLNDAAAARANQVLITFP